MVEYQRRANVSNRFKDKNSVSAPLLGVFGETGTLLTGAKKRLREADNNSVYKAEIVEELGDVLWYVTVMLSSAGLTIADAVSAHTQEARTLPQYADTFLLLDEMFRAEKHDIDDDFDYVNSVLLPLASAVGRLVDRCHAYDVADNTLDFKQHVGKVLEALVNVASAASVPMQTVAEKNLFKVFDRWPEHKSYKRNFDAGFESIEQFPEKIIIDVFEQEIGGKLYVYQKCGDIFLGDRLTDNKIEEDDYRFHDVFHYAYAAVLSWSPVLRRLLKRKRKSNHRVDEAEDGARAAIIEEGVVAWVFSQALNSDLFMDVQEGALSFGLLKQVRNFTNGYEVDELPLWQWEEAILQGFDAFRYLTKHRSARLTIDTVSHKLTFGKMS